MTILGTRPEIIKLSPLLPLLDKHFQNIIVHTGQHYSYELDKIFFEEIKLRKPDYHLNVGSGTQAYQTGMMMIGIEEIALKEKPELIIVQGDTNTTLAGALVAAKLHIPLAHIEAGYRSGNVRMPEEINRIITDRFSRYLFVGIEEGMEHLKQEGINHAGVFLTGNTALDALRRNEKHATEAILHTLLVQKEKYVLVTVHRADNTEENNLQEIVKALNCLAEKITLVFPLHPRTKNALDLFNVSLSSKIKVIEPVGYLDCIALMKHARFVMTDSGGIQEESVGLNIPCLVLRNETEAIQLVKMGKTILASNQSAKIIDFAKKLLLDSELQKIKMRPCPNDLGVAERIVSILKKELA